MIMKKGYCYKHASNREEYIKIIRFNPFQVMRVFCTKNCYGISLLNADEFSIRLDFKRTNKQAFKQIFEKAQNKINSEKI